jgi:hypothetical protein
VLRCITDANGTSRHLSIVGFQRVAAVGEGHLLAKAQSSALGHGGRKPSSISRMAADALPGSEEETRNPCGPQGLR